MLLSLLILLTMYLLGLTFIIGLILFIIGQLKKDKKNKIRKTGLIIGSIPIGCIILLLVFNLINEIFTSKPNKETLVGIYQIVKVTQLDIDKDTYDQYVLKLNKGNTFTLTPTPYIDICISGEYKVNYKMYYNELSLWCPSVISSVHIDRNFGDFQIEFVIGDPDSGQSIFFEKIGNQK